MSNPTAPTHRANPPALVIRLPLEQPPVVYLDAMTEGEELRLREDLAARGLLEPLHALGIRMAA